MWEKGSIDGDDIQLKIFFETSPNTHYLKVAGHKDGGRLAIPDAEYDRGSS